MTLDELRAIVSYDAETGRFTWLQQSARKVRVGSLAGTIHPRQQRRYLTIRNRKFQCARLAWWFVTGAEPVGQVDHINGDKLDDRFVNLRDVSQRVNAENVRTARVSNRLGVLGVRRGRYGGFAARLMVGRREIHLGTFKSAAEAHAAYVEAKRRHHEGCTL